MRYFGTRLAIAYRLNIPAPQFGKRAIHTNSDRCDGPLVKVNCASVSQDLFESKFFGHVRGSFTGAHRDRVGRLELANTGTLFLDEVGEIPLDLQGKLLRAQQEQEFERIGDEKTLSVDVRIVAANKFLSVGFLLSYCF